MIFLLVMETGIRVLGINTDIARSRNAQIAVPVWLLADNQWVDLQRSRRPSEAIPVDEVSWLLNFEEARHIQYKMKPGVSVEAVNPFNSIEIEKGVTFHLASNSSGFRELEFTPKRAGTFRIVTIGDSSTFGWGVDREHTYQKLLQERLNELSDTRFEVLNLGIPGHTSRHGLGMLRHYALPLQPDLLIIGYGANDPRFVPIPADELLAGHEGRLASLRFALLRLRTYRLLPRAAFAMFNPLSVRRARDESAVPSDDPTAGRGDDNDEPSRLTPSPDNVQSVPWLQYQRNLRQMIEIGRAAGASSILLSICVSDTYNAAMRYAASEEHVQMLASLQLFINAMPKLLSRQLYVMDVLDYQRLYGPEAMGEMQRLYVTSDGCHPNRVGHKLITEALLDAVLQIESPNKPAAPDPSDGSGR